MILRTSAYVTSDQQTFAELDAAIGHELNLIFPNGDGTAVEIILKNRDRIVDLLNTKENSRPKARKANGATRKPRKSATPELPMPSKSDEHFGL